MFDIVLAIPNDKELLMFEKAVGPTSHRRANFTYEFKEELLDVEGGKQLALSVDHDLSRGLAWNRLIWLHDL